MRADGSRFCCDSPFPFIPSIVPNPSFFTHKTQIVLKGLCEIAYPLKLPGPSDIVYNNRVRAVTREADEDARIFGCADLTSRETRDTPSK